MIVSGRYYQREYTQDEQLKITFNLEATAVGHDLARGTSDFTKVVRTRAVQVEVDEDGLPADRSDEWLDLAKLSPSDEPAAAHDRAESQLAVAVG